MLISSRVFALRISCARQACVYLNISVCIDECVSALLHNDVISNSNFYDINCKGTHLLISWQYKIHVGK